jgi:hypothetical protein
MAWFSRRTLAVLALGVVLAGCNGLNSGNGSSRIAVGDTAPPASGEDAEGHAFALADYRGKVVMLSFWANF